MKQGMVVNGEGQSGRALLSCVENKSPETDAAMSERWPFSERGAGTSVGVE